MDKALANALAAGVRYGYESAPRAADEEQGETGSHLIGERRGADFEAPGAPEGAESE